jgi:hypothetical protein
MPRKLQRRKKRITRSNVEKPLWVKNHKLILSVEKSKEVKGNLNRPLKLTIRLLNNTALN